MNNNLNNMLNLMNNVSLEGSLTIIDKYNNNEVITVTQEPYTHKFVIKFSSGSPIEAKTDTFPIAMQYITNRLDESEYEWEIDQRELGDMDLLD